MNFPPNSNRSKADARLAGVFFVFALLYVAFLHLAPYPGHFIVKAVPIAALAGMAALFLEGMTRIWLVLGLVASLSGDILLEFPQPLGPQYFIFGLSAFALAHLFYVGAFLSRTAFKPSRVPLMGAMILAAGMVALLLQPYLGELQGPVMGYIAILTGMALASTARAGVHPGIMAGATLFMISDTLIALNKFISPFPQAPLLIMVSYYSAQYLIVRSFIQPEG